MSAVLSGDLSAAKHYAYDYGHSHCPKTYKDSHGRRIVYGWIDGVGGGSGNQTWQGSNPVMNPVRPRHPIPLPPRQPATQAHLA